MGSAMKWIPPWFWNWTLRATPGRRGAQYATWQINNRRRLAPLVRRTSR